MSDQKYIRAKDITLVITVLTLLGTVWKLSGLEAIKEGILTHTIQIAVIQNQLVDIKNDLSEIKGRQSVPSVRH